MDISDIIAVALGGAGFTISIIGLIITPLLNLKSKRLEKRLEFRFQLFQKVLELWEITHSSQSLDKTAEPILWEVNKLIQLYGYNSEIQLFRSVINNYNQFTKETNETNKEELILSFNQFFENSFNTYRREIILEQLDE